jgi:Endoplasmic reticulum-based factor for assembly of V-ATPase
MVSTAYKKTLEGVHRSEKLQSVVDQCVLLIDTLVVKGKDVEGDASVNKSLSKEDAASMLQEFDRLLTPQKQQRQPKEPSRPDNAEDRAAQIQHAKSVVQQYKKDNSDKHQERQPWIPIPVLQAIQVILEQQPPKWSLSDERAVNHQSQDLLQQLEDALSNTRLMFTPPPPVPAEIPFEEMTPEQQAYHKRMGRLRLAQEETKYSKLTRNLDTNKNKGDDISGKSMTFAASVGLNMIVAPISFGVFMYWFGGTLLDWWLGEQFIEDAKQQGMRHHTPVDIKKVMIGVISGVAMLFIEMTLFVIRTHEFESHQLKKAKMNKLKPTSQAFGPYSSNTPKTTTKK